jgi:hypothetical protein
MKTITGLTQRRPEDLFSAIIVTTKVGVKKTLAREASTPLDTIIGVRFAAQRTVKRVILYTRSLAAAHNRL